MRKANLASVLHSYPAARRCDTDENGTRNHTRFCPDLYAQGIRVGLRKQPPTTSTSTANPQSTSHDPLSAASTAAKANRAALLSSIPERHPHLLVTQRDDGINAHGTPRGDITGQ